MKESDKKQILIDFCEELKKLKEMGLKEERVNRILKFWEYIDNKVIKSQE